MPLFEEADGPFNAVSALAGAGVEADRATDLRCPI